MPNWKKVAVSGSAASFSSLYVDTSVTASIFSGSQFSGSFSGSFYGVITNSVTSSYASTVGFNFEQVTPSDTWTVNHNLNNRHPLVQIYDSNHVMFIPLSISSSDNNTVVITFSSAYTGYARVV